MGSRHKMILGLGLIALAAMAISYEHEKDDRPTSTLNGGTSTWIEYTDKIAKQYPRGALPATSPSSWVISDDYPDAAIYSGFEGRTGVVVTVNTFGEVDGCKVTRSSGVLAFDRKACLAIEARARFYPALDENQKPVSGTYATTVAWQLVE